MENNNSQNEYFAKKEFKEKETRLKETKNKTKRILVWATALLVVGFGFKIFVAPIFYAPEVSEVLGEYFPAQTRDHIAVGQTHPEYNSNPPTGGWHYASPAQTGIYDEELPDEQLIHNLEHGHVWIAYRPDLDEETVEELAKIAKSYSSKIIVTPRPANDAPVIILAWEYLLKLEDFDEGQILGFIKAHRGKGPENIPDFGFGDFRQKQN